jgi:hypothetical protein
MDDRRSDPLATLLAIAWYGYLAWSLMGDARRRVVKARAAVVIQRARIEFKMVTEPAWVSELRVTRYRRHPKGELEAFSADSD